MGRSFACNFMKILQINTYYKYGSTGRIVYQLQQSAIERGHNCTVAFGFEKSDNKFPDTYTITTNLSSRLHYIFYKLTGLQGIFSFFSTQKFIKFVKKLKPDFIHLHNLHGSYINHRLLFSYIKKSRTPVVWTLHDCWSFTGLCAHFTLAKCDRWQTGCGNCPSIGDLLRTRLDFTKHMWRKKRKWFTGVENMMIVAPSQWLAGLIKQSYLKEYETKIIYNGIDLEVFKPTKSDFRRRNGLEDKHIVLGVALCWERRKGADVFIELEKRLDKNLYKIVLVGVDAHIAKTLPSNILSIDRTNSQVELAEIYTAADLFVNPTREEVFGLVNAEALACGIPVVTFNTGGSVEVVDENSGSIVDCDDVDALEKEIIRICTYKPFTQENCIKRAYEFNIKDNNKAIIDTYESMVDEKES